MGATTGIEWTEHTWNPWRGCRHVSEGCRFCYMFRDQKRYGQDPRVVQRTKTWAAPLKWQREAAAAGRTDLVFTCSWSDWFIEEADEWRNEAWAVIRQCPNLIFQILTKRPGRIAGHLPPDWPLPNVWLGFSAEDQDSFNRRAVQIIDVPAAVLFVSLEPLLGEVDVTRAWLGDRSGFINCLDGRLTCKATANDGSEFWVETEDPIKQRLDWVIAGGESAAPDEAARPSHPDWFRTVRDQCQAAGVPFFFKQWGEWAPMTGELMRIGPDSTPVALVKTTGRVIRPYSALDAPGAEMIRIGKRAAGRLLDGETWDQMPAYEGATP